MMRCLLLLLCTLSCMGQAPDFALSRDGELALSLPRPFLEQKEVREQLETGLTTTFAITLQARNGRVRQAGGCRIDIRYELWDQIYFIKLWQHDASLIELTLDSFEALVDWFGASHALLTILQPNNSPWLLELTIDILPFSQREAERTKRWAHQNLGYGSDSKRDPNKVLDLLVASSIRRRSLNRYVFKRELVP